MTPTIDPLEGYLRIGAEVIKQAIYDLKFIGNESFDDCENSSKNKIGLDAYDFLSGKRLDKWCNILGLNADYIREQVNKTCKIPKKILVTPKTLE